MTDDLDAARYARMRWNTPLSEAHADLLLDRLAPAGHRVADIGCGWGELLLRAVERDPAALRRGRLDADRRGLAGRVEFVETQGESWGGTATRALCGTRVGRQPGRARRADRDRAAGRAAEVRQWLETREREYLTVYRGVLGLAYLVLAL